jgi:hypothetical protein
MNPHTLGPDQTFDNLEAMIGSTKAEKTRPAALSREELGCSDGGKF